METFNISDPLTSVAQENAATMFCCESPGMFSGTTNFLLHEGEQKMMNCHCYVNLSFNARAHERLVCSRAVLKMHHCYIFGFVPHKEIQTTAEHFVFCTRTGAARPSSSTDTALWVIMRVVSTFPSSKEENKFLSQNVQPLTDFICQFDNCLTAISQGCIPTIFFVPVM